MSDLALSMAAGQLAQARRWLAVAAGRELPGKGKWSEPPLVRVLGHMRSACGWLLA